MLISKLVRNGAVLPLLALVCLAHVSASAATLQYDLARERTYSLLSPSFDESGGLHFDVVGDAAENDGDLVTLCVYTKLLIDTVNTFNDGTKASADLEWIGVPGWPEEVFEFYQVPFENGWHRLETSVQVEIGQTYQRPAPTHRERSLQP